MSARLLTDDHVTTLRKHVERKKLSPTDTAAVSDIIHLANTIVQLEFRKKSINDVDCEDISQIAFADALNAVKNQECKDGQSLTHLVKRSVWREAQRRHRVNTRATCREVPIIGVPPILDRDLPPDIRAVLSEENASGLLYREQRTEKESSHAVSDLLVVEDELLDYFKAHPEKMYQLTPRKFEELVAAMLKNLGYSVELTAEGADGGIDIIASQKSGIGELLLIVDCKKYSPTHHVGVGIVRSMYGIAEHMRATMGMIATTSFFTRPAKQFQEDVRNRLSLKDYDDLVGWLFSVGCLGSG